MASRWYQALLRSLLGLLYPQRCCICGSPQPGICLACQRSLPRIQPPICDTCGRPYPGVAPEGLALQCGECRTRKRSFDRCRSVLLYHGPAGQAIRAAKYRGRPVVANALGEFLWHCAATPPPLFPWSEVNAVVPVPLHPSREAARGFNQAEAIITPLCRRLGLPLRPELLVRERNIPPQVGLKATQRRENVHGAFVAPHPEAVKGATLLLFDDVMTTGATVEECARMLKKAKAARVWVLTAARQVSDL